MGFLVFGRHLAQCLTSSLRMVEHGNGPIAEVGAGVRERPPSQNPGWLPNEAIHDSETILA